MDPVTNIEAQYFHNAKLFILYRTGDELPDATIDLFRKSINSSGYFRLAAKHIVILLVKEVSDTATHIEPFRAMLRDTAKHAKGSDMEIICSFMMTSSNVPKMRITSFEKTFREETAAIRTKRIMISASGLFAFNPLVRDVPMDARYEKNLPVDMRKANILRSAVLSDDQKKVYDHRIGIGNFPTVQQNEIECLWNNYYEGDIISVENLSPTTIGAIIIRRVTAPVTNHIKETQENQEEDANDD